MLELTQYVICIKDNKGEIISIAREKPDKSLVFDLVDETTTDEKKVAVYPDAGAAKRSALARIKHCMYVSDKVLEKINKGINPIDSTKIEYWEYNMIHYKDIKENIDTCEVLIRYEIV